MAIAFDASSSFPFGAGPITGSHTAASGSVLWVHVRVDTLTAPTGVTFAGVAMTMLEDNVVGGSWNYSLWYLDNIGNSGGPSSGTQTITVSGPSSASYEAESYSGFTGARIGIDAHGSAASTSVSTISKSVTTGTDNCWYVVAAADRSGTAPTANSGWTSRIAAGGGASTAFGDLNGVVHPAGSVTAVANVNSGGASGIIVAAFYIVSGPPAGTVTITGGAPAIRTQVAAQVGFVALSGRAPALLFALFPAAAALAFSTYAPTITNSRTLAPGAGTTTVTGAAPAIRTQVAVGAGSVALSGAAISVSVVSASDTVVTINGTDCSRYTNRYETTIDQNGDATPDSCTLMVRGITPTVGMRVTVTTGTGLTEFDGQITDIELVQRRNGTRKRYRCKCTDWTFLLDRRLVTGSWTATAANTIVTSIISSSTSGFTTTNVQGSLTAVDFSAFLEAPSSVLQRLANAVGAVFKVRYDKDVYFRTTTNLSSPATIDATNTTYKSLSYHQNIDQIRTRVYVKGGALTTVPQVDTLSPSNQAAGSADIAGGLTHFANYKWCYVYTTIHGDSAPSTPPSGSYTIQAVGGATVVNINDSANAAVTGKKLYRTKANGSVFFFEANIANGTTSYSSTMNDASLGVQLPTTYGALVDGTTTAAGSTSLVLTDSSGIAASGAILVETQTVNVSGSTPTVVSTMIITYTGGGGTAGRSVLTGIPASGYGSITSALPSSTSIQSLFAQRDDTPAQTALAALEGGDGVHEFYIDNSSLATIAACNAYGDAELAKGKSIVEGVTLVSEDVLMVPTASVTINISGISTTLPIAHVTISWKVGRLSAQRDVTATSQYKTFSQYLADIQTQAAKAA